MSCMRTFTPPPQDSMCIQPGAQTPERMCFKSNGPVQADKKVRYEPGRADRANREHTIASGLCLLGTRVSSHGLALRAASDGLCPALTPDSSFYSPTFPAQHFAMQPSHAYFHVFINNRYGCHELQHHELLNLNRLLYMQMLLLQVTDWLCSVAKNALSCQL